MPKRNPNKLTAVWDARQKDFLVKYPRRCDGSLLMYHLLSDVMLHDFLKKEGDRGYTTFNLKKELEDRGYDLKTLKFSIELKEPIHPQN